MPSVILLCSLITPLALAVGSGSLAVSIVPRTQQSVPQGAQRVPVLTIRLAASCAASVPVSAVTVRHSGLGSVADFLRVYVMDGEKRISATHAVPEKDALRIRLRAYALTACASRDLNVFADMASDAAAGGEHRFDLVTVDAKGSVEYSAQSSSSPASLRVTPSSTQFSVRIEFRPVLTPVYWGTDRIVARLLVSGGASADQEVTAMTFTNDGSARNADMQNLYMETSGHQQLSEPVPQMDGRTVRIVFDPPLKLPRNAAKLLHLRADVRASSSHTIEWTIDEPSDVEARTAGRR